MESSAEDGLDAVEPLTSPDSGTCWSYVTNGLTVVVVTGEIDLDSAPAFRRELTEAVTNGSGQVLIDLSQVSFMDSSGLGVLVGAQRRARELGGTITLIGPQAEVRKILGITHLDQVFPIHDTMADVTPQG